MTIKLLSIILSTIILLLVIELTRREKLTFKYSFGWMAIALAGIVLSVFDQWLFGISAFLGFVLPSNFIFFVLLTLFVFLSLFLTIFLCQQNNRNDTMAQKIGMLDLEVRQLKQEKENAQR